MKIDFSNQNKAYVKGFKRWADGSYTKGKNSVEAYLDMETEEKWRVTDHYLCEIKKLSQNPRLKIHEIGCGPGAHLRYIHKKKSEYILSGNDVWPDAIQSIKDECDFIKTYRKQTRDFIDHCIDNKIKFDVLISGAHIIHLENDDINYISELSKICKACILCENISNLDSLFKKGCNVKKFLSPLPRQWGDYKHTFIIQFEDLD